MGFESVFTAFGMGLLGLGLSLALFMVELMTSGFAVCRKLMNAYNYRHDVKPKSGARPVDEKQVKPKSGPADGKINKVTSIEVPNPW